MLTASPLVAQAHQRAEEIDDVLTLIRALGETYNNPDTHREELALEAVTEGRAAWWVTTGYGNQSLLNVGLHANRRSLAAALDAFADDKYPSPSRHRLYLLAHVVPLNSRAITEKEALVAEAIRRAA